jgi:hypothetical protein
MATVLFALPLALQSSDFIYAVQHSPAFEEFMTLMGEKTPMQGHKGFRGGLDVNSACLLRSFFVVLLTDVTSPTLWRIWSDAPFLQRTAPARILSTRNSAATKLCTT